MPDGYADLHKIVDEQAAELSSDIQYALKDPNIPEQRLDSLLKLKLAIAQFLHAQKV